jgi:Holliday junction resolvasome RuvABC endonuclease subunit
VQALKRELAGFSRAAKEDMVATALKVGIKLPETKDGGQEDAADAVAAWLTGIRAYARRDVRDAWDRRLHSPRGMLL